ncbi:Protein LIFEGUARD 2 [Turnera subulata]|uniref:Protein LIFEGUARD 2 n=1 Tax=Turnera subulata TaxID=218843 RepID=A0A9Q0F9R0_9ROSI|nr:Protein LIFEGUARD 2 [Turnera subulata]
MWGNKGGAAGGDIESGAAQQPLYPLMNEPPQIRWAFIRKVYIILSMQLLLTAAVAATVVFVRPVSTFVLHTKAGLAVYIVSLILPFIILCALFALHKRHPINFVLLALFTITLAFGIGLSCAHSKGRVVLEAAILTAVVSVSLTLYTFWAAKRGHDFSFMGPFLFASLLVLICFGFIQVLFPLGKISLMIYGGLGALIFSGYIIYDTDNLIKRFSYDEYILASITLYLDVINLFQALLLLLGAADD